MLPSRRKSSTALKTTIHSRLQEVPGFLASHPAARSTVFLLTLAFGLSLLGFSAESDSAKPVLGTWEGESICTVHPSPCHDEHVVYEIAPKKQEDKQKAGALEVAAYKIVNGEKLYMGSLFCDYTAAKSELRCHYRADDLWVFSITGDEMKGTLVINSGTLYRRINVKRKSSPPA